MNIHFLRTLGVHFRRFVWITGLVMIAVSCGPPRCKIPGCYVRMLHRHSTGGGYAEAKTPRNIDPSVGVDPDAQLGKVYRGVPWWKRNKNPKIGFGYKPERKYSYYKVVKPDAKKIMKANEKRQEEQAEKEKVITSEQTPAGEDVASDKKQSRAERKAKKRQKKSGEELDILEIDATKKPGAETTDENASGEEKAAPKKEKKSKKSKKKKDDTPEFIEKSPTPPDTTKKNGF